MRARACWTALLFVAGCKRVEPPSVEAGGVPSNLAPRELGEPPLDAAVDAAPVDAVAEVDAGATPASFGTLRQAEKVGCGYLKSGAFRLAERDIVSSFVTSDDPFALLNRSPTGALAYDDVPADLVILATQKDADAKQCAGQQCLRRDAAAAFHELREAMRAQGLRVMVESAYRSYASQCGTFAHWSRQSSACKATEQSALPGHSQHQLGTVLDLFTEAWRSKGPVFRHGFGCNEGGKYLRDEAWKQGFVISYPIHPDDRHPASDCEVRSDLPTRVNPLTGYGHEAWHMRWLGKPAAAEYHAAHVADPMLTLEQWLRKKRGLPAEVATELPVCDGCNCGACASLDGDRGPCKGRALRLDDHGRVQVPDGEVSLQAARFVEARDGAKVVELELTVRGEALTQPPLFLSGKAGYEAGEHVDAVASVRAGGARRFPRLPGAYRLAVGDGARWPYQIALPVEAVAAPYDRANVYLPARTGAQRARLAVPESRPFAALLRDGKVVSKLTIAPAAAEP